MRLFLCSVALAATSTAFAAPYGLPLGSSMPAFEAADQDGKTHTLQSLLGPHGAALIFYRSADWCVICKSQLVELDRSRQQFEAMGLGLAAISYDSVAVLHDFAERHEIHFPLLSDADSKIIRSVGILNEKIARNDAYYGIPHAGVFILDATGKIKSKHFEEDYHDRFTAAGILTQQFGVPLEADPHEVVGKQLTAMASASSFSVKPGQHVALHLDVALKPQMHIYAPGAQGYIPIEWTFKDSPAFTASPAKLPASKMLHLPAINETVPVYAGNFRIGGDITLSPEAKLKDLVDSTGQFTVEGTLKYQACDDRMCYLPQSLNVKWTFQLEGQDKQRAPEALRKKAAN